MTEDETPPRDSLKMPMQPVVTNEQGVTRFAENRIIVRLAEEARNRVFDVSAWGYSAEELFQYYQLLGHETKHIPIQSIQQEVRVADAVQAAVSQAKATPKIEILEALVHMMASQSYDQSRALKLLQAEVADHLEEINKLR